MTAFAAELDLPTLDAAIDAAIERGAPVGVPIVGFGEIALVLGWPPERPALAVKRLPVFENAAAAERHGALVASYTRALRDRRVDVIDTEVRMQPAPGGVHAYIVQPLVPREQVMSVALTSAPPGRAEAWLDRLVEIVCGAVDERLGLDAQAGNWAVEDGRLALFDVSTPLMRSPDGGDQLDVALFASVYPAALRPVLRRVAHRIAAEYHDARTVLVDVASNLHKEGLDRCIPMLLAAAGTRVAPPITQREVLRYFQRDRALWLLMQRLRRLDRAWQRGVRRRPYPFLLPPPYHYGPMTPPGEVPS